MSNCLTINDLLLSPRRLNLFRMKNSNIERPNQVYQRERNSNLPSADKNIINRSNFVNYARERRIPDRHSVDSNDRTNMNTYNRKSQRERVLTKSKGITIK